MSKLFLGTMVAVLSVALALALALAYGYDTLNDQLLRTIDSVLLYCMTKGE